MKPNLFYFNPTVEMAVVNGSPFYQPPQLLQTFEREMAPIMQFLSSPDDIVVLEDDRNQLYAASSLLTGNSPRFLTFTELYNNAQSFNYLVPWGWSPALYNRFSPVWHKFSDEFRASKNGAWNPIFPTLLNRITSNKILLQILDKHEISGLINSNSVPVLCTTPEQIEKIFSTLGQIVLKAPISSSGRGVLMLRKNILNNANKAWIKSVIEHQGGIITEPLFKKIADLSFHFNLKNSRAEYLGCIFFKTNSNGGFQGCYLNNPPEIERFLQSVSKTINEIIPVLTRLIEQNYGIHYDGYIGVDAMIVDENNTICLHPCVEINMRSTMGLVTLKMKEKLGNINGFWEIIYAPQGLETKKSDNQIPLFPVKTGSIFGAFLSYL